MAKHKKPTTKELEENLKKTAEELEDLKDKPSPAPSEPAPSEPALSPEPVPSEPEPTPSEPEPSPDYKKKFIASTKEAQVLHARNKKMSEVFDKATDVPIPTDEEMRQDYSDWEMMSDFEKKLAKDNVINNRRFAAIGEIAKDFKDFDKWQKKVNKFATDPKTLINYPDLEGKVNDFKFFATKPTRRGIDFEDLVSAFLYEEGKKVKPKMKTKMFEVGSGGPSEKEKAKKGKISLEEARNLRKRDYKKYTEYVRAGRIDTSEI